MFKFINLTPHTININETILESEGVCRCKEKIEVIGNIGGIDIIVKEYGDVEGLPEYQENVCYIVSVIIAMAVQGKRHDCFVPGETIRDEQGIIVGCKNLAQI